MIYQLSDFFQIIQAHHRQHKPFRHLDLLGRVASLYRAGTMSDDSRRALKLFLDRHIA